MIVRTPAKAQRCAAASEVGVVTNASVSRSHTFSVLSSGADTTRRASALTYTALTKFESPANDMQTFQNVITHCSGAVSFNTMALIRMDLTLGKVVISARIPDSSKRRDGALGPDPVVQRIVGGPVPLDPVEVRSFTPESIKQKLTDILDPKRHKVRRRIDP